MSTDNKNKPTDDELRELEGCVQRIQRHQEALGLSDRDFVAAYSQHISSDRTLGRLKARQFDEVRVKRTLPRLRSMVAELDGGTPVENVWEDLPVFKQFYQRYRLLTGRKTDRRAMVMLAAEGGGKSVSARVTCAKHPKETVYVRCRPTWRNRELRILRGIGAALGVEEQAYADDQLEAVIAKMKAEPKTIFIDEAHDAGVSLLKLVKTFIDETACRFVIMAFPTIWRRLILSSDDAHAEARQLMRRTLKPVFDDYARGTDVDNIAIYLDKSLGFNGKSRDVAGAIVEIVRQNGNLSFVHDVIDTADTLHIEQGMEITGKTIIDLCHQMADRQTRRAQS